MDVKLTLQPGDRGTKKLLGIYGDKLVCVRYRYDKKRKKRMKTVETIIEEIPWNPPPARNTLVALKIRYTEKDLQQLIKNAGGKWDKEKKVWRLAYGDVAFLGLETRMVGEG